MIPVAYANFLVASTQASAALLGLLFVSVSIAPERVFGGRADSGRQAQARSAFTALANVFFISFTSLIPSQPVGLVVLTIALVALSQTLSLLLLLPGLWRDRTGIWTTTLFLASGAIYGYEIAIGLRLLARPTDEGALTTLLLLLLGGYAVGLARAWELLGAPHSGGLVASVANLLRARLRQSAGDSSDAPEDRVVPPQTGEG